MQTYRETFRLLYTGSAFAPSFRLGLAAQSVRCHPHKSYAELSLNASLRLVMATAGSPQLCQDCSRSTLAERVCHGYALHVAGFARARRPRPYIRLTKSKTPCSAQSVGSQATVSTSEKNFQVWWQNADVKAALSSADFEGITFQVLTVVAASTQPELTA